MFSAIHYRLLYINRVLFKIQQLHQMPLIKKYNFPTSYRLDFIMSYHASFNSLSRWRFFLEAVPTCLFVSINKIVFFANIGNLFVTLSFTLYLLMTTTVFACGVVCFTNLALQFAWKLVNSTLLFKLFPP